MVSSPLSHKRQEDKDKVYLTWLVASTQFMVYLTRICGLNEWMDSQTRYNYKQRSKCEKPKKPPLCTHKNPKDKIIWHQWGQTVSPAKILRISLCFHRIITGLKAIMVLKMTSKCNDEFETYFVILKKNQYTNLMLKIISSIMRLFSWSYWCSILL